MRACSALSGRLLALKYYDEYHNRDLSHLPSWQEVSRDDFALCRSILAYHTNNTFLSKLEDLWRSWFLLEYDKEKFWAQDIVWAYRLGLSEIFVHQKLAENIVTARDLSIDPKVFDEYVQMKSMMNVVQYRALSAAFELNDRKQIIFMYIRLAEIFGIPEIQRRWITSISFQDMLDNKLPERIITS